MFNRMTAWMMLILVAVTLTSVACSHPGLATQEQEDAEVPLEQTGSYLPGEEEVLTWRRLSQRSDGMDLAVPGVTLEGDRLLINLPNLPAYEILDVTVEDETLTVHTDICDTPSAAWASTLCGLNPQDNLVVLELEGLDCSRVMEVRILGESGVSVDMQLSFEQAVEVVRDFCEADFGWPQVFGLQFTEIDGQNRLVYSIDYMDNQLIDRTGSSAVSGHFAVDAVTGEILYANERVVPLEDTSLLVRGGEFLAWTADGDLLLMIDGELCLYDAGGSLLREVPVSVPLEGLALSGLQESAAYFGTPGGDCLRVCLDTGAAGGDECPVWPAPESVVAEEIVREAGDRSTSVTIGLSGFVVHLASEEGWKQERASAEVRVSHGDDEVAVAVDILEDYVGLRTWKASEATEAVYFVTEIFGPRYAMWVTEYALWELIPRTGGLRRVSLLPTPNIALSPDGHRVAYQWEDRVFLIDLKAGRD